MPNCAAFPAFRFAACGLRRTIFAPGSSSADAGPSTSKIPQVEFLDDADQGLFAAPALLEVARQGPRRVAREDELQQVPVIGLRFHSVGCRLQAHRDEMGASRAVAQLYRRLGEAAVAAELDDAAVERLVRVPPCLPVFAHGGVLHGGDGLEQRLQAAAGGAPTRQQVYGKHLEAGYDLIDLAHVFARQCQDADALAARDVDQVLGL